MKQNKPIKLLQVLFYAIFLNLSLTSHSQSDIDSDLLNDPTLISYNIRSEQYSLGNLVKNPSFENGKISGETFLLNNWEMIGSNIQWVDKSSFRFSASEVYEGMKSVRITKNLSDETTESEGLLSDFIEILPGNYSFTLYLKLLNISPNTVRFGTRLYDAVDIKLLYFDSDKKPLNPNIYNPATKSMVNNSFKSFSFSNLWHVDDFDWGFIHAKTASYPFAEGDIPENVRYVKIFIGLKGTGTMWIDKVDLHYSKWNFTPSEKISGFITANYSPVDLLLPTPKQISNVKTIKWYDKSNNNACPVILMPSYQGKQTKLAAELLKEHLESIMKSVLGKSYKKEMVVLTSKLTDSLAKSASMIFSIGNNEMCLRFIDSLPEKAIQDKDQGYFIKNINDKIIFLKGNTSIGDYYAVTTLIQLFDNKDFILNSATIIDYPDFRNRSLLLTAWNSHEESKKDITSMKKMSMWKLNKAYIGYAQPNKNWFAPTDIYLRGVELASGFCNKTGLFNLAVMVNPYYHLKYKSSADSLSDYEKYIWSHNDPNSLTVLINTLRPALDSGVSTIMFNTDDYLPYKGDIQQNYSLYTPEDKARFVNLQNAHAFIINEIYKWLKDNYPGTRLEFCPPWYYNEAANLSRGKADNYFSDITQLIPNDVAFVWSGNTVRSLSIDNADIWSFKEFIGKYPMLWDNTLYARSITGANGGFPEYYPQKIKLCNLFEPLDIILPDNFYKYNNDAQMFVNGDIYSERYLVKYMTVADYEWNNAAYNPDLSLWKALCKLYGQDNAIKLMEFNDYYYSLVQLIGYVSNNNISFKEAKELGNSLTKKINTCYGELAKNMKYETALLNELENLKEFQIKEFKYAIYIAGKNKK